MSKKSHHFLTLWPWPLTYDLDKLITSGHYHYQCVYQIWEQSIPCFFSYRVNTIAGGGRRVAGGWRLRSKTITSPDPSDTGYIIINIADYTHQRFFSSLHAYSTNTGYMLFDGKGMLLRMCFHAKNQSDYGLMMQPQQYFWVHKGPLLLTWFNLNPSMAK